MRIQIRSEERRAYGRSSRTILPFGCSWRYQFCGHCISEPALQRRCALCGRWVCLDIISGCVDQAGSFGYLRCSCRAGVSMYTSIKILIRTYRSMLVFEAMTVCLYGCVFRRWWRDEVYIVRLGINNTEAHVIEGYRNAHHSMSSI
jgi:hypothetical protein